MKNLFIVGFMLFSFMSFSQKAQTIKFTVVENNIAVIKERLKTFQEVTEKLNKTSITFDGKTVFSNSKGNLFVIWVENNQVFKKTLPKKG